MHKTIKISAKTKRWLVPAVKFAVVFVAFLYIYKQVFLREDIADTLNVYRKLFDENKNSWLLLLVFFLMPVNWGLEALKWQMLVRKIEKIKFITAFESVLSGITVSFFTPNRVGEYIGRVFHLEKADKIKAAILSVLGSMAQLLITILAGLTALLVYLWQTKSAEHFYFYCSILFLCLLFGGLLILLFFNASVLAYWFYKLKRFRAYRRYAFVLAYHNAQELLPILLISALRYLVFSVQFYFLLLLLGVEIPFWYAIEMIALTFLVMAVVPTLALTEIGVRGSVAIYFIGSFSTNNFGILTASFTLWIINLAIPALIGSIAVFSAKIVK